MLFFYAVTEAAQNEVWQKVESPPSLETDRLSSFEIVKDALLTFVMAAALSRKRV